MIRSLLCSIALLAAVSAVRAGELDTDAVKGKAVAPVVPVATAPVAASELDGESPTAAHRHGGWGYGGGYGGYRGGSYGGYRGYGYGGYGLSIGFGSYRPYGYGGYGGGYYGGYRSYYGGGYGGYGGGFGGYSSYVSVGYSPVYGGCW
jgi:hypothetical protein